MLCEQDPSKPSHSIGMARKTVRKAFSSIEACKTQDKRCQKSHSQIQCTLAPCPSGLHHPSLQGTFPSLGPTCRVASRRSSPLGGGLLWPSPARFVTPAELSPENPSRSQPPALGGSALRGFLPLCPARAQRTRLGASQLHVHVRGGGACGCAPRQHALRR